MKSFFPAYSTLVTRPPELPSLLRESAEPGDADAPASLCREHCQHPLHVAQPIDFFLNVRGTLSLLFKTWPFFEPVCICCL